MVSTSAASRSSTPSYSQDSAAKAVALVREGRAEALMKGSLHTDEIMGAVVARDTGLRTVAAHQPLLHHGRARTTTSR